MISGHKISGWRRSAGNPRTAEILAAVSVTHHMAFSNRSPFQRDTGPERLFGYFAGLVSGRSGYAPETVHYHAIIDCRASHHDLGQLIFKCLIIAQRILR
jgi:hypothetical protein